MTTEDFDGVEGANDLCPENNWGRPMPKDEERTPGFQAAAEAVMSGESVSAGTPPPPGLPPQGGARMLNVSPDKQQVATLVPIRAPAEIGKAESPQNVEFADYTPAQLRQTLTDTQRQLGQVAARSQDLQGELNNARRNMNDALQELAGARRRENDALQELAEVQGRVHILEDECKRMQESNEKFSRRNADLESELYLETNKMTDAPQRRKRSKRELALVLIRAAEALLEKDKK